MMHKSTRCLFFVALLAMGSCCRSLQAQEAYEKNDSTKPLYLNVKTNMLYDALLIPNIGLEVDLGKRWSDCCQLDVRLVGQCSPKLVLACLWGRCCDTQMDRKCSRQKAAHRSSHRRIRTNLHLRLRDWRAGLYGR